MAWLLALARFCGPGSEGEGGGGKRVHTFQDHKGGVLLYRAMPPIHPFSSSAPRALPRSTLGGLTRYAPHAMRNSLALRESEKRGIAMQISLPR